MVKYTDEDVDALLKANQASEKNLEILQKGHRAVARLLTQVATGLKDGRVDIATGKLEEAQDAIDTTILSTNQMLIDVRGPQKLFKGRRKKKDS